MESYTTNIKMTKILKEEYKSLEKKAKLNLIRWNATSRTHKKKRYKVLDYIFPKKNSLEELEKMSGEELLEKINLFIIKQEIIYHKEYEARNEEVSITKSRFDSSPISVFFPDEEVGKYTHTTYNTTIEEANRKYTLMEGKSKDLLEKIMKDVEWDSYYLTPINNGDPEEEYGTLNYRLGFFNFGTIITYSFANCEQADEMRKDKRFIKDSLESRLVKNIKRTIEQMQKTKS